MNADNAQTIGQVLAIAIRPEKNAPMKTLDAVSVSVQGLKGDQPSIPDRGVTLISKRQWDTVCDELSAELPWHTRRANLLIDADGLGDLIGKRIRIGAIEVEVRLEVKPCGLMDKLHLGLRERLVPDCRGGVGGRILNDGEIRTGDTVVLVG
ncbi:MAG TPA: MOSC domain-containing protein [Phycisphaerae bacterium]|nr:MOSC domain-containing protein [Phycisphaerae bacterium]HRW54312.1 MOSC domain-containing protein [Phycisphaerae bacterium]